MERSFSCTTRYTKAHATMRWVIRDVSARDTHGERLRSAEFVVGTSGSSKQTAWIILCNFGTQNYEDYVSAHVKLVTKASQVCADVELSIVGAYGSKVNTETKTARIFSNDDGTNDGNANESTWGYFSFAKRADLRFNPEWVPNDSLTIAARVSVYGENETLSSSNGDVGSEKNEDHLEALSHDLTSLFVEAQDDEEDLSREGGSNETIVIQTQEKSFKVHRSVLAARSLVFRRMLEHQPLKQQTALDLKPDASSCTIANSGSSAPVTSCSSSSSAPVSSSSSSPAATSSWSESGSGIICIPDVGADVIRHFLLYLYGSRVPADMDEQLAEELLVIADKYDVERLRSACEVALSTSLTESTVPRLLVIAERHRCSKLKADALSYLTLNPAQILETAEWKIIEENHPSIIVDALRAMASR